MVGWSLSFCCSYFGESRKVTFSFFLRISMILSGNSPPIPIPAPRSGKKKKNPILSNQCCGPLFWLGEVTRCNHHLCSHYTHIQPPSVSRLLFTHRNMSIFSSSLIPEGNPSCCEQLPGFSCQACGRVVPFSVDNVVH